MRDPKFGYHYLWLTPLALILCGVSGVVTKQRDLKHKRHMKRVLKNPEISELSKLSGIEQ